MKSKDEIREQVFLILQKKSSKGVEVSGASRIIEDLLLTSDDATEVILSLERSTGSKPPIQEWKKVFIVDEMINLLTKYCPCK